MDWMEDLTVRIHKENHKDDDYLASFMDLVQRSQKELPTDKSQIKFMKPICLRELDRKLATDESNAAEELSAEEPSQQKEGVDVPRLVFYTPYVTFGYCYSQNEKSNRERHKELLEKYKGRILHGPRSLDRFYYNTLPQPEMDERDQSQVITRGLLNLKMGDPFPKVFRKWPYLTVDQLWVWVIDEETIITSSTHREDDFDALLFEKVWDNLLQASQDGFREKLPSTVTEMSHFLVSTCADFINNLTWEDVCGENYKELPREVKDAWLKPILLWYADSINSAAAKEKILYKSYKDRMAAAARAKEVVEKKTTGQDKNHQQDAENYDMKKDENDWKTINSAATLLDEVKDIRDELMIMRLLVTQQEGVLKGLMGPDPKSRKMQSLSFIVNELDNMVKTTDSIQKSVLQISLLAWRWIADNCQIDYFINIKQSMMSLDLSAENAKQGNILFIFTIVTVIFTPLSFLSSLLAINTTTSRHNDDGELEYEPAWMYGIICKFSSLPGCHPALITKEG
ncbi:hypothetical protein PFICI_06872 [Pestalotiopsis fici W106-1]|uniref:Uncharacterized protein n=1 Tax=Pestalotiopsis fici (strain W106-1 / CGMCC3.15140) TaxID=1229662 RepID=W3X743_PESFW|nr:uncharacterized protein PFICI_06872 [Pestalotiopsis fici W106-1]ETS81870.1 hypothetical protein PFICI_06872 [Pestalotiopsis fici W106-1]